MITRGEPAAPIWIVGEAPGEREVEEGKPFVGPSGWELSKMLRESGIAESNCFFCNVCNERPPGNDIELFFPRKKAATAAGLTLLHGRYPTREIRDGLAELTALLAQSSPRLILALGATPLWALTGLSGIGKWRGSQLQYGERAVDLVPTWHPAAVLRNWPSRPEAVADLRRARDVLDGRRRQPDWKFLIRPRLADVLGGLESLRCCIDDGIPIVCDIETRRFQIACVGFASDPFTAMCVPFMSVESPEGYWSESEEFEIIQHMRDVMTNPKAQFVFQNGIYDCQYFAKQFGFVPRVTHDTMIAQHTLFPELPKALDYQASIFCDHYVYWKDDGKLWHPELGEDQQWTYNCTDCVRTYELLNVQQSLLSSMHKRDQFAFQMRVFQTALRGMLRGIAVDRARKAQVGRELAAAKEDTKRWLANVLSWPGFNPNSHPQMSQLFYEEFGCKPVINRKTHNPTLDDEALKMISRRNPVLRPVCEKIAEYRSLGVFKSTFADMELSADQRMRCSINLTGTQTFRFSTSEDAFGSGGNLENLPKGTED